MRSSTYLRVVLAAAALQSLTTRADRRRRFVPSGEKAGRDGSLSGPIDPETVAHLWSALERASKATAVRQQLLDVTMVRR